MELLKELSICIIHIDDTMGLVPTTGADYKSITKLGPDCGSFSTA